MKHYTKAHGEQRKNIVKVRLTEDELKRVKNIAENLNLSCAEYIRQMNACADLNLTSRSEYSQIFDQQMSIRRQVKQKNQQQQQYEQNSHCKSRDHQELE
jgi:hypothetical protein